MRKLIFITCILLVGAGILNAQQSDFPKLTGPYLGQKPPGNIPEAFAPAILISFLQQIQGSGQKEAQDWVKANSPKQGEVPKIFQEKFRKYLEDLQQGLTSKIDENNAALERDYQLRKRSQERLAVNLSRVSPASALMFSAMSLARTGVDEHDRFLASIRSYKPIFTKWANAKMMKSIDFSGTGQTTKVVLDDMPAHKFEAETLNKSLARAIPDFGVMLFLIIVFFAGAYVSFLKYDVR